MALSRGSERVSSPARPMFEMSILDLLRLGDAESLNVQRDDGPEVQPGDGVHRLIAVQNALRGWQGGVGFRRDAVARSDRAHETACEEQDDGTDREPGKGRPEVRSGLRTEIGRKNQVACSEEHREQGKTDEQQLFAFQRLHGKTSLV